MISFATEFPVRHEHRLQAFQRAIRDWILGSPHTGLSSADFEGIESCGEWSTRHGNERLDILNFGSHTQDSAAAKYVKVDGGLEWVTTIVFSRGPTDSWVAIRTSCESSHPSARLPSARKPVVVRTLLQALRGGADGVLDVTQAPHRLADTDIDLAARLISGRSNCRLPAVYVSAGFHGHHAVDADRLASDLAGMAHVVVEPNRPFSLRLKLDVNGENAYGGAVGVYWPEAGGRRSFFPHRDQDSESDLHQAITAEVTSALANRRSLDRCTWASVQQLVSRSAFDALKAAGSNEVGRYVEEFDKELVAKQEQLDAAEKEIARLQAEVRKYEARVPMGSGIVLRTGQEQDLYPGEIADIVRDALDDASTRVPDDSRRRHVLLAVANACTSVGDGEQMRQHIKDLLRGMTSVDAKIRRGLETIGFSVSDDGKHNKLVFRGDDRYTFTLPKTGSDHRGGLNAASDICRLLL